MTSYVLNNDEAKQLLNLLQKIDSGYQPTKEERQWLNKIDYVNLGDRGLTTLPESIRLLPQLEILWLHGNQFTNLPVVLRQLSGLQTLSIQNNPLKELPDWIADFQKLRCLYLNDLKLTELPPWLPRLSNLEILSIKNNPLRELPDWIADFPKLRCLYLNDLKLTELPESLLRLNLPFLTDNDEFFKQHYQGISIANTEISIQPVSLFDQSRDKSPNRQESRKLIEDYFACPKVPIREAKVIFLGDGKVGKTFTIQRLLHSCEKGTYPTEETHGILIEDLHPVKDGEEYTVRIWDFGGQDIMHEMHRCFLTDRTCYVVMVDTRSPKQTARARYWLRTIQNIAPKAPVRLLVNQISGGQNLDLDYNALKAEFDNLKGVEYCSSLTATDEEFRDKVERPIINEALQLDSCKMYLPESWEKVRQCLLNMKHTLKEDGKPAYYIDRQAFHSLCDENGVPQDDGLRAWLLTWFNDLGVCFSYHLEDGKERDTDYKILDPMWLTSAVYKIIWDKEQNDDGLVELSEIYKILKQPGSEKLKKDGIPCIDGVTYDETECGYVLDIMRMFRISYQVDDTKEFMPTLCKADSKLEPTPKRWIQHAAYKFRYNFLPESVVHRLMIFCYKNLQPGKRWRKGFWLECSAQGLSAVIQTVGNDENELQIDVYAQKEAYKAWMWLQPICKEIHKINQLLKLSTTDYLLAENEIESKWFKRDTIWNWRKKGTTELQGEDTYFTIESLMLLIYGDCYQSEEQKLLDKSKEEKLAVTTESLPQMMTEGLAQLTQIDLNQPLDAQLALTLVQALNQVTNALQSNTTATKQNTEAERRNTIATQINSTAIRENTRILEDTNVILMAIRDDKVPVSDKLLKALAEELRKSNSPALKSTGQKMKWMFWKNKAHLLRDLLGDAANFATVAPVAVQLWTTYGDELTQLAQTAISSLPFV